MKKNGKNRTNTKQDLRREVEEVIYFGRVQKAIPTPLDIAISHTVQKMIREKDFPYQQKQITQEAQEDPPELEIYEEQLEEVLPEEIFKEPSKPGNTIREIAVFTSRTDLPDELERLAEYTGLGIVDLKPGDKEAILKKYSSDLIEKSITEGFRRWDSPMYKARRGMLK